MRKRRVVGRIYGMKYSWKGHKDRNRHKNSKKRSGQIRLIYVKGINRNILTPVGISRAGADWRTQPWIERLRGSSLESPACIIHRLSIRAVLVFPSFLFCSPWREAGDVWCLSPVWNLRAVIWFHFATSSLVLLPTPVALSVLSFSACWPFLLNFFQKIFQYFSLRDRLFCMAPV